MPKLNARSLWIPVVLVAVLTIVGSRLQVEMVDAVREAASLPFEYHHDSAAKEPLNTTLGFEKIYAINLEHRHDRRDQLSLLSAFSELQLTHAPGVMVDNNSNSSLHGFPPNSSELRPSKLGCFRAHANVWRRVVDDNVRTALILEDDVDWDVNIKSVAASLQEPLKALIFALESDKFDVKTTTQDASDDDQGKWTLLWSRVHDWMHKIVRYTTTTIIKQKSASSSAKSNWNEQSWDILRLGTCADYAHQATSKAIDVDIEKPPYVLFQDRHVTAKDETIYEHSAALDHYEVPMAEKELDDSNDARYRIIQKSNYPVCLHAYAVSRLGAAKLLHITSQGLIDGANDLTIARRTQQGHLRSFTVIPSVFGQWKNLNWAGNSDTEVVNPQWRLNEDNKQPKYAYDIRSSIRARLEQLIKESSIL